MNKNQTELSPTDIDISALFNKAIQQGSAMEVIKELRMMETDFQARKAKRLFDDAMSLFQSDCPVIEKQTGVPDRTGRIAYKFAKLEAVEIQIKPHERAHGFNHTFPIAGAELGWVTATCRVKHSGGHSEDATVKYPIGTKTAIMSDTQQYAAAETFCKRRALCNGYGLTLIGDDTDASTGMIKPAGPSSIATDNVSLEKLRVALWNLMTPVRGEQQNWKAANQWMWDECVQELTESAPNYTAERFKAVIEAAKKRLEKKG
jgi:hypothetical protein